MSSLSLNIVNAKSLEKQLKVVEGRIQELQTEIRDLEKVKTACQILLGTPAEFGTPEVAVAASATTPNDFAGKSSKKKSEKKATDAEEIPSDFAPEESAEMSENAPTTEVHQ